MDPFDTIAGWIQQTWLTPLLWHTGLIAWEDLSYGWILFATYGAAQVALMFALCVPLERYFPVERWPDNKAVATDIFYTLLQRVGVLPLVTFVGFYEVQVTLNGWLTDHGYIPPTIERVLPFLIGHQAATFIAYAIILDLAEYWRHRISHRFRWWWSLHSLHHAQRQMTFWSDDRNHLLDDLIGAVWFGAIALLIGVSPLQFPLLVLLLRLLESVSHANAKIDFGPILGRILISPRFHRAHHGIRATGQRSCNYGAILPWWDMLFGTADFSRSYARTGDPSAEEALATGSYLAQQMAGLRRMAGKARSAAPASSGSIRGQAFADPGHEQTGYLP